jgi:hypothetical protein
VIAFFGTYRQKIQDVTLIAMLCLFLLAAYSIWSQNRHFVSVFAKGFSNVKT